MPADRRRRAWRASAARLLALLALAPLAAGCGDRGDDTSTAPASVALPAAAVGVGAPRSARFQLTHARIAHGTGGATGLSSFDIVAEGQVDVDRGLVELRSSLASVGQLDQLGYAGTAPSVAAATHLVYDLGARQAFVERDGAWVSTPFPQDEPGGLPGPELYDPTRVLGYLRGSAAGEAEAARATVDGVPATRRRLLLRTDAILGEGWVALAWTADASGTVLQLELTNGFDDLTLHFTAFDEPVSIERPPAG